MRLQENTMDKKTVMENMAREAYERGVFNGLWLYAENGEIVSKGAYGFRDTEDKLPMQEDSIFQLASITKPFTSVAIMLLIREGRLSLEDKIVKFFPELTDYKDVTVRHLLTHTGGIPDVDDSPWLTDLWQEEKHIPPNSIVLRYLTESGEGPCFAPGEEFGYSNTGYCLLAEIVEKVSGFPFEAFMKKYIFEPAGMKDTGIFHIRRDGAPSDRFVRNLVLEDGKYILPGDSRSIENYFEVAEDGLNGCDFAFTTIFDMLAWDRALREETVLTLEEQKMMFTPGKLNNGEEICYDDDDAEESYYVFSILFSGALMMIALFAMSDGATLPMTKTGRLISGVICGVLIFIGRKVGGGFEWGYFAVLTVNALALPIEKLTAPRVAGAPRRAKVIKE